MKEVGFTRETIMEPKRDPRKPAELLMTRDWQNLLKERPDQWVAYGKDGFLASSFDYDELYRLLAEKKVRLQDCTISHVSNDLEVNEEDVPVVRLSWGSRVVEPGQGE